MNQMCYQWFLFQEQSNKEQEQPAFANERSIDG